MTDKKAKVVYTLNFQDEMEVNPDMVFNQWFVQPAIPGATPHAVTNGFYNYNGADYSADGKQLFFTAHIDSTQDPERDLEGEIYVADADGEHFHLLLGEKGKVFSSPILVPTAPHLYTNRTPLPSSPWRN